MSGALGKIPFNVGCFVYFKYTLIEAVMVSLIYRVNPEYFLSDPDLTF
jgi:hypothetical protein